MEKFKQNNKSRSKQVLYSIATVAIIAMAVACSKPDVPVQPSIKVYQATGQAITNPPDTFIMRYNLYPNNLSQNALIISESAVWEISQTPSPQFQAWIQRETTPELKVDITTKTKVALEGTTEYTVWGLNYKFTERKTLDLKFKKTDLDYETFDPKL
ncbi:MAG: hypothetical protein JEZ03_17420 [Bacteroidales bacterium]|nr:hypothetical protein [Bacteroidales bacterium]